MRRRCWRYGQAPHHAGSWDTTQTAEGKRFLADKMVALDPSKAALALHLLCRSPAPGASSRRDVVRVSTIYLAAAVRDNVAGTDDPAIVYGTEHEPGKASAAERNLDRSWGRRVCGHPLRRSARRR